MAHGKSIATVNIANLLKENNFKVLIIDFDVLNNCLHTLLNVDKYPEIIKEKVQKNDLKNNKIKVNELVININDNIDLISGINLLFDNKYKISSSKIKDILEELKQYYDYIIVDNTSECFFDYTKNIIENSDFNIYLLEANLLEIKKAKKLLEIYTNEWKISNEKINILINKYDRYSIKENSIKNIFYGYKIIGKINFNRKYISLINNNYKKNGILKRKIRNELNEVFQLSTN